MKRPRKEEHKYLVIYDTPECLGEQDIMNGTYQDIDAVLKYLKTTGHISNYEIVGVVG